VTLTPMFPLQSVLLPYAGLPLHIFEERYRTMMRQGHRSFGVVLIDRGPEVGGGDVRSSIGTLAHVVESEELADGRWILVAAGGDRFRVREWLADDPYPQAEVELLDEGPPASSGLLDETERLVRRSLALKAELDEPAPPMTVELSPDATVRGWQLCAISPLGPVDRQRLLAVDRADERLSMLAEVVAEECSVLAHRLSGA
jgi:uncharacterized protein